MSKRLLVLILITAAWTFQAAGAETADKVVVNKARREMMLLRQGRVLRTYRIALGRDPFGAKRRQGDGKTPEGDYVISGRNSKSAFHRSLRVSYPNAVDRSRAKRNNLDPGGDIMIHGLPNGQAAIGEAHRLIDWTEGCIAVTNAEIEEIWAMVANGTPIRINP